MFTFEISTGRLTRGGVYVGLGYSGDPAHKNNPDAVKLAGQGPIPPGDYSIGLPEDSAELGPHVMALEAVPGTVTFGRSGFFMHGDSLEHPGAASHGCVIMARGVREDISSSGDRVLRVIE